MVKRSFKHGLKPKTNNSHKTKKRLEIKKVMLAKKTDKKKSKKGFK